MLQSPQLSTERFIWSHDLRVFLPDKKPVTRNQKPPEHPTDILLGRIIIKNGVQFEITKVLADFAYKPISDNLDIWEPIILFKNTATGELRFGFLTDLSVAGIIMTLKKHGYVFADEPVVPESAPLPPLPGGKVPDDFND